MAEFKIYFQDGQTLVVAADSFDFEIDSRSRQRPTFIFKDGKGEVIPIFLQSSKVSAIAGYPGVREDKFTVYLNCHNSFVIAGAAFKSEISDTLSFYDKEGTFLPNIFVRPGDVLLIKPGEYR